jgi:leukotriene-A4 hydrolase
MKPLVNSLMMTLGVAGLAACQPVEQRMSMNEPLTVAPILTTPDARDVHSHARPAEARIHHVDLDLAVDFGTKRLSGTATLDLLVAPGATSIILDAKGLDVASVTDITGAPLAWTMGAEDKILGAPLTVQLGQARRIVIRYASRPDAGALQWLSPEQTAGKKLPYLFSQGQAILNRSWIPTQDSPGIRQTWAARLTVPRGMRAVMSAEHVGEGDCTAAATCTYAFRMDRPVAPYLIALAVGDIMFQPLGPRTGVYTEPAMLQKSAWELTDLEQMVTAAESLYGPYRWGRYDLLVLPPSFPFGGMENPRLTFATPTILAGDRSLVSLVAHELAHSWSGNLVTNATWNDFWLNEGFTVYFENRIMEKLYGAPRAAMLADLGWTDMHEAIETAGGMTAPDSRLHLDLAGRDPDDGMTDVAYEKSATFLRTIEAAVGRARFDAWLRSYFDRYAFQPQTSAGFLADIQAKLIKGDAALEQALGLDLWVYQPGLPDNAVHVRSDAFALVDARAKAFAAGGPASAVPFASWSTQEQVRFFNSLPRALNSARLADLDRSFGLSASGNSEIRFAWLMLAIANRYQPAVPSLDAFLTAQGRRKFVAPLFTALMKQPGWGPPIARDIYARARGGYHSVTVGTVDQVVK